MQILRTWNAIVDNVYSFLVFRLQTIISFGWLDGCWTRAAGRLSLAEMGPGVQPRAAQSIAAERSEYVTNSQFKTDGSFTLLRIGKALTSIEWDGLWTPGWIGLGHEKPAWGPAWSPLRPRRSARQASTVVSHPGFATTALSPRCRRRRRGARTAGPYYQGCV